tara:strand:- start:166 stop:438 length:273 start_codon:yes stop_codon:yes gene_type:complete
MQKITEQKGRMNPNFLAILVTWSITVGGFIWSTATTNAEYNYKIERIEKELIVLDERLDLAETFRMEIRTDLAQIKTDLIWIRKDLERGN